MRSALGVGYALGGAVVGFGVGVLAALAFAKLTNASDREGAIGYFAIALAIIGAVIGLGVGIALFARSAPAGQGGAYGGSAVLGVVGLVAVVALGAWGWASSMEKPLEYDGARANLELELRVKSSEVPADLSARWLDIEVQTSKTRPVATMLMSSVRTEDGHHIIPAVQGPLYRASGRVIVVRIDERQREVFRPPMKRTPDSRADWSDWYRPAVVEPPYGVEPKEPLRSILELRYRVRRYGE